MLRVERNRRMHCAGERPARLAKLLSQPLSEGVEIGLSRAFASDPTGEDRDPARIGRIARRQRQLCSLQLLNRLECDLPRSEIGELLLLEQPQLRLCVEWLGMVACRPLWSQVGRTAIERARYSVGAGRWQEGRQLLDLPESGFEIADLDELEKALLDGMDAGLIFAEIGKRVLCLTALKLDARPLVRQALLRLGFKLPLFRVKCMVDSDCAAGFLKSLCGQTWPIQASPQLFTH
jgi:hypothetical protein